MTDPQREMNKLNEIDKAVDEQKPGGKIWDKFQIHGNSEE